ncbi:MAG: hypothetical protein M1832_003544 [Thelocarpon impressellum]|nr:MAG: hypothetical protein M1832_003544 [Thelocarpon impressellum]
MDKGGTDASAAQHETMHINPARAKQLGDALGSVKARIHAVSPGRPVRLVAVSKLKPASDILALHKPPHSHVHFGENYLQELQTKAVLLPRTIEWHFIGALQTNKCAAVAQIPNLHLVSSVDSAKKADALDKGRAKLLEASPAAERLAVHVQINTSGEASKSGLPSPEDASSLCAHIRSSCPHLRLAGLMTIGALARSQASSSPEAENEDFLALRRVRDAVAESLNVAVEELELSMGMSEDFESAIAAGSDEVRVGSTIFGARPPRSEARIVEGVEGVEGVKGGAS